jgi:hypothetical protein
MAALALGDDKAMSLGDGSNVHESKHALGLEQLHPGFVNACLPQSVDWRTKGSRLGSSAGGEGGDDLLTLDDLAEDAAAYVSVTFSDRCLESTLRGSS